ncbi:MAG: class I SAM-dependent methyltransferase [Anaerolineae bacterium]
MPTFEEIYAYHAAEYDALISREDYQGNLLKTLAAIRPLAGLDVVEMGAGTGRFTRMLAPHVKSIRAYDASQHMLDKAAETLRALGVSNWTVQAADNRAIPAEDGSADLSIAGWSFGHSVAWYPDTWRIEIGKAIGELTRVLRLGGAAVIVETLGTGAETPNPPTPGLAAYYAWLESEHGFTRTAIRTDYQFESLAEAESLARFFFGDAMGDAVIRKQWVILPEYTGVWVKRL